MKKAVFDKIGDSEVIAYTISNGKDLEAVVCTYGARLLNLYYTDKNGNRLDMVYGYDDIDGYLNSTMYEGSTAGRVCNRITAAEFKLNGVVYRVDKNERNNLLHGGKEGTSEVIWDVEKATDDTIVFVLNDYDGHNGFPGNVTIKSIYQIIGDDLYVHYEVTTDKATPINLTNHSYFNLNGRGNENVNDHIIKMMSSYVVDTDKELLPTGVISDVTGTAFDTRNGVKLGDIIYSDNPKIREMNGLDTCFVFDRHTDNDNVIELTSARTGIGLNVKTDYTSVQIYSANNIGDRSQCGVCLETSLLPDSVNHPNFDDTILNPGETFDKFTVYSFYHINK